MSRDMIKKLKALKRKDINPRAEWVKTNREILLSQIKNNQTSEVQKAFGERFWTGMSVFVPQKIVFSVVRPLAILLVVAVVGTSGWITAVDAAYEALPGDLLYTAKRMMEKTQAGAVDLLQDKNAQTKLHAEFAKRRASEIKSVVKSNVDDKEIKISETLADLKKEMGSINAGLEGVKAEKTEAEDMVNTIKEVQKNTEKIKVDLKEAKDDLLASAEITSTELTDGIAEVKQLNKEIEVKVVEVVVSKHLEEGSEITKENVVEVVDAALKSSLNELKTAQGEVKVVSGIIEDVKAVAATSTTSSTVFGNESNTSTPEAVKLADVSTQAKAAVEKNATAGQEADKKISEVKEILQAGSITEIVEKVKQVAEIVKVADQTTAETIQAAKGVLPSTAVEATSDALNEVSVPVVNSVVSTTIITSTAATSTASTTTIKTN